MYSHYPTHIHSFVRGRRGTKSVPPPGQYEFHIQNTEKKYDRFQQIKLPEPSEILIPASKLFETRRSQRVGEADIPLTLTEISTVLGHAIAVRSDGKRPYPSGGALYPIEAYVIANNVEGLSSGVLHYRPSTHSLEYLVDIPNQLTIIEQPQEPDLFDTIAAYVVLTANWNRQYGKYGDFCYELALLEAGHVAQNVLLVANGTGLGSCPVAGFHDETITELLDIDDSNEQIVYVITLCKSKDRP